MAPQIFKLTSKKHVIPALKYVKNLDFEIAFQNLGINYSI